MTATPDSPLTDAEVERFAEEILSLMPENRAHPQIVEAALSAVRRIARAAAERATERAAEVAEGGAFLHGDSPEARFGKAMAAAIRRG